MHDQGERPSVMKVDPSGLPGSLKARAHWVCWKLIWDGTRWTKVPIDPKTGKYASSTDPSTWGTFAQAWSYYQGHRSDGIMGIGFVFTKDDPYTGVDLDHCRDAETGAIQPWALEVVQYLNSYTELSPSGTGMHIYVRGVLPPGLRKKGDVEMYEEAHYLTVTGNLVPGVSQGIEGRERELGVLHTRFLGNDQGTIFITSLALRAVRRRRPPGTVKRCSRGCYMRNCPRQTWRSSGS
jgi:putative DNA primase/helicase